MSRQAYGPWRSQEQRELEVGRAHSSGGSRRARVAKLIAAQGHLGGRLGLGLGRSLGDSLLLGPRLLLRCGLQGQRAVSRRDSKVVAVAFFGTSFLAVVFLAVACGEQADACQMPEEPTVSGQVAVANQTCAEGKTRESRVPSCSLRALQPPSESAFSPFLSGCW